MLHPCLCQDVKGIACPCLCQDMKGIAHPCLCQDEEVADEQHLQQLKARVRPAVHAAQCCMLIMTSHDMHKSVYHEEVIERVVQLARTQTVNLYQLLHSHTSSTGEDSYSLPAAVQSHKLYR